MIPEPSLPQARRLEAGVLAVLVSAVGYGSIPFFAMVGYAGNLTPEIAVVARYGFPALLLGWLLPRALKSGTGGKQFMLTGMLMGLGAWAFFKALALLPITLAILLFFSYPLFSQALKLAMSRRGIGFYGVLSALLSVIGVILALISSAGDTAFSTKGLAFGLMAPAAYALVLHKMNHGADYLAPLQVAACLFAGTLLITMPLFLLSDTPQAFPEGLSGWGALLGLMLLTGILPQFLMAYGAPIAGRAITASAGGLEFMTALVLGSVAVQSVPSPLEWVSAGFIVIALVLASRLDKAEFDR
ncbi:EamA family transporter [Pseudovibrio exalbescens]|uniref:EamA family transporter n=1 Tax=Pseudovibrio exalbescens TaxID=197461 RepID=UPI000C9A103B|nr:EamA family transporter [Pseudovibrio exalbescens]